MERSSVVLVEDDKIEPMSRLISDLCEMSGIESHSLCISGMSQQEGFARNHIMVLNEGRPNLSLARALDTVIAGGVIIMNADEKNFSGLRLSKPVRLITYGYNPKSTVTASSIIVHENIAVQCCIQRQFYTLNGQILEPREFMVSTNLMELNATDILAAVSVAMLLGVCSEKISPKPMIAASS